MFSVCVLVLITFLVWVSACAKVQFILKSQHRAVQCRSLSQPTGVILCVREKVSYCIASTNLWDSAKLGQGLLQTSEDRKSGLKLFKYRLSTSEKWRLSWGLWTSKAAASLRLAFHWKWACVNDMQGLVENQESTNKAECAQKNKTFFLQSCRTYT